MLKKHYLITAMIGFFLAFQVNAEEFRQHEAHVHGEVEFDIAQDGTEVLIEITAPGMDILGFEHEPQNEHEHRLIKNAIKQLEQAHSIISLNPEAECKITHSHAAISDEEEEHHHEHNQASHEHKHHHEHSAFIIEYHYQCNHESQLQSLSTQWFEHFKHTHEIEANIFTDHEQTSATLTPKNTKIRL